MFNKNSMFYKNYLCSSKLSVFKLTLRKFLSIQLEKLGGTLMEQLAKIEPVVEDLRHRRDERVNEFKAIQSKIVRLQAKFQEPLIMEILLLLW
jgi:hypothetical protein